MFNALKGLGRGPKNLLTDVEGLTVGNAEDFNALTGVTVVLADTPAVAAVHIAGGAPGTRETNALASQSLVQTVDAIVLSGGSVYGLDAASGVTAWLGARGQGYQVADVAVRAPIVPAAILFDLGNGGKKDWGEAPPYFDLGKQAAVAASGNFSLGNAGAGLGATAGTLKGGLGSASIVSASGLGVSALVAANPVGSVVIPGTDKLWAAPFEIEGEFGARGWPDLPLRAALADPFEQTKLDARSAAANTTIAVIATNANLNRPELQRVAIMAHDGLARAIRPVHTPFDGDSIFALATGRFDIDGDRPAMIAAVGSLAADTLARAIARAIYEATAIGTHKALRK